jgi:hypothetical protein
MSYFGVTSDQCHTRRAKLNSKLLQVQPPEASRYVPTCAPSGCSDRVNLFTRASRAALDSYTATWLVNYAIQGYD